MKLKYLLIGANHNHNDIVKIYKENEPEETILNLLKEYLTRQEWFEEYSGNHQLIEEYPDEFDRIDWFLSESKDTYLTLEYTELL
jgi:hypothetical protein